LCTFFNNLGILCYIRSRFLGSLMKDNYQWCDRMWSWPDLFYYHAICWKRIRQSTKNTLLGCFFCGRDSKQTPTKCKSAWAIYLCVSGLESKWLSCVRIYSLFPLYFAFSFEARFSLRLLRKLGAEERRNILTYSNLCE
jgi:hypothetical protein